MIADVIDEVGLAVEQQKPALLVFRLPRPDQLDKDLRLWPESMILRALERLGIEAPRVVAQEIYPQMLVTNYLGGKSLDQMFPKGKKIPDPLLQSIMGNFKQRAMIGVEDLKGKLHLPDTYPKDGNTTGYLHEVVADFTREFHRKFREFYQRKPSGYDLFGKLGIPMDPFISLENKKLAKRRFGFNHGDPHRGNMRVITGNVIELDYELATCGDPLYDLKLFLRRMDLSSEQTKRANGASIA